MENGASTPWSLTINNSTISNNRAGDAGGGIETDGTGNVSIGTGTLIEANTSVNQGAGIWLDAIGPGTVTTPTITKGGSGYTSAPTVVFSGGAPTAPAMPRELDKHVLPPYTIEPGDVLLDLAAERPFDGVVAIKQPGDAGDLVVGEFLGPAERIDAGLLAQAQRQRRPDAVDVAQRDVGRLVVGKLDAELGHRAGGRIRYGHGSPYLQT